MTTKTTHKHTNPFPPLIVSEQDQTKIEQLVQALLEHYVAKYDQFVCTEKEIIPSHWHTVRKEKDITVYVNEEDQTSTTDLSEWTYAEATDYRPLSHILQSSIRKATDYPNRHIVRLTAVGRVQGNLGDAVFGSIARTTEEMRLKNAYVGDKVKNCCVLKELIEPTMEQPMQSLTIKWRLHRHQMRPLLSDQDYVYLESTGIMHLLTGETIGYQLMHSIAFPSTESLLGISRSNLAFCVFFRQTSREEMQVYAHGNVFARRKMLRNAMVHATAKSIGTSLANVAYCAQMKKVAWALRPDIQLSEEEDGGYYSKSCYTCSKALKSSRQQAGCHKCVHALCTSCQITRRIYYLSSADMLCSHQVTLCAFCLKRMTELEPQSMLRSKLTASKTSETEMTSSDLTNDMISTRQSSYFMDNRRTSTCFRDNQVISGTIIYL